MYKISILLFLDQLEWVYIDTEIITTIRDYLENNAVAINETTEKKIYGL